MAVGKVNVGRKSVCGKVANLSVKSVSKVGLVKKPLLPTEPKKIRNKKIMSPTIYYQVDVGQKSVESRLIDNLLSSSYII
jgi:hypothetical protein